VNGTAKGTLIKAQTAIIAEKRDIKAMFLIFVFENEVLLFASLNFFHPA